MNTTLATIAVVVPAHQAAGEIGRCVGALLAAGFAPQDILVVDDGSRDTTGDRARALGVRVLRNETARGAAEARNRGAEAVAADLVLFIDADVVVHSDVRSRILARFEADPALTALIGSYDDAPPAPSVIGRYRNLLHHYVHQRSSAAASTFWTGLGVVRRDRFLYLGGFDKGWEKIEDVEFGVRLRRAGGTILLDHGLQGTHLKAWTLGSMLRTDLFGRALPWSRLVLFHGGPTNDLNLVAAHRVSVVLVGTFGLALAATPLAPGFAVPALASCIGFAYANRRFLGFLVRREGVAFTLAALLFHALHYMAAGLGYTWVLLTEGPRHAFGRRVDGKS